MQICVLKVTKTNYGSCTISHAQGPAYNALAVAHVRMHAHMLTLLKLLSARLCRTTYLRPSLP